MYDKSLIEDKLVPVAEALEEVLWRLQGVSTPLDSTIDRETKMRLDSIAMILLGIGETFKKIDKMTGGSWLTNYPDVNWSNLIGMRDVMAHDYFGIDYVEVVRSCQENVPVLLETVEKMLSDLA